MNRERLLWALSHPRRAFHHREAWWLHPVYFWQRGRRGYSDSDTWSFFFYLSDVIAGGAQQLRDRKIGHPARLTEKEWDDILDEMIAGFKHNAEHDDGHESLDRSLELFATYYRDLWD